MRRIGQKDVTVDFDGTSLDLASLVILLTMREHVHAGGGEVWVHDLPESSWRLLEALGLEDRFFYLGDEEESFDS